jgi:hypothetical protein
LNQTRRRDGERYQQRRPAHSPPRERASFLGITVVVTVVMPAMAVIVASVVIVIVCVRLAQLAAPG